MALSDPMPEFLRPFFWDVDFDALRWEPYQDFIVRRVLQSGSWEAVCWLKRGLGDAWLRDWLLRHKGARLDPRRLRFWQVVLHLPERSVDRWLASAQNIPWMHRLAP